jgi:integrase
MANVTERNGKFHVRVYRKGASAVCKSFAIRKDALVWAKQTEADIQSGRWLDSKVEEAITLKQALDKYRTEITPSKKSSVQESYVIGAIARVTVATKSITSISSVNIAVIRDQWKNEGLAPATILRRMAILSHVFEIACKEWGYIGLINPVKQIRKPIVSNARDRRLFTGELEAVLNASLSADLPNVARLALATSMRMSEVVGLRWKDISTANSTLTLQTTKNGSPRVVALSPEALSLLNGLVKRFDGKVFNVLGASMCKAWRRSVKRGREVYELDCKAKRIKPSNSFLVDLHFHDLRHEATSRLFELGCLNVVEVASITGHKTLSMLSRYSHMDASRIADKLRIASS